MVDVITCAIFCDCRLMGVGVVRGEISPSPIDLRQWRSQGGTLVHVPRRRTGKKFLRAVDLDLLLQAMTLY